VNKVWKLVNIWRRYGQKFGGTFCYGPRCVLTSQRSSSVGVHSGWHGRLTSPDVRGTSTLPLSRPGLTGGHRGQRVDSGTGTRDAAGTCRCRCPVDVVTVFCGVRRGRWRAPVYVTANWTLQLHTDRHTSHVTSIHNGLKVSIALHKIFAELLSVTCRMGSHSVTRHRWKRPGLTPAGRPVLDLPTT